MILVDVRGARLEMTLDQFLKGIVRLEFMILQFRFKWHCRNRKIPEELETFRSYILEEPPYCFNLRVLSTWLDSSPRPSMVCGEEP
jgi:hypothetical protein